MVLIPRLYIYFCCIMAIRPTQATNVLKGFLFASTTIDQSTNFGNMLFKQNRSHAAIKMCIFADDGTFYNTTWWRTEPMV